MAPDLVVLGQDPRFGGGGVALTQAFVTATRELGRDTTLLYDRHPGLGGRRLTWRRVEGLRQLAAARKLEPEVRAARSAWVAASLPQHGSAAARSGRPYGCWVATTIGAEWRGRAPGLTQPRRLAGAVSIPLLQRLERHVLTNAVALYTTSPAGRTEIADIAGRPEREVGLLPIPIDCDRFEPAPDHEWREALSGPVITFVGRASDPRKNLPLLLDAFRHLRSTHPNALLRLIGEPPGGAVPAGVEVVGEVPDVGAELRRAAILVLPSRQEGFGIVAAEALAAGLPVVSTRSGGPDELLNVSGGGQLTEGFGADELAAAISDLVDDPSRAAAMRERGRAYVAEIHAPERFRELIASALRELDGS